ncbi:MAG: hypothetical protein AAF604_13080 [Acidobacteriota bacterium]
MKHREVETLHELDHLIARGEDLADHVFQGLDLRGREHLFRDRDLRGTVFLGCRFDQAPSPASGAILLPTLPDLPYRPYRGTLYSPEELLAGYDRQRKESYQQTPDGRIWQHYRDTGRANPPSLTETLARRLHDHAMSDALEEAIAGHRVVGVMGGHSLQRTDPSFRQVARLTRRLTRRGYLMVSGGGPGAMEACHLGAWFAERSADDLDEALGLLAPAPGYKPREAWLATAWEVRERFPLSPTDLETCRSLAVPTWLYGHEPSTVFASWIAKYFANSVREDGLVTIAHHGLIFAPGGPGTIQEIFQDVTQNHYQTFGPPSPMILLGEAYWSDVKPVFPLLRRLADGHPWAQHLTLTDSSDEALRTIEAFS